MYSFIDRIFNQAVRNDTSIDSLQYYPADPSKKVKKTALVDLVVVKTPKSISVGMGWDGSLGVRRFRALSIYIIGPAI